jgi:mannose-6-phosphate isomerase class I
MVHLCCKGSFFMGYLINPVRFDDREAVNVIPDLLPSTGSVVQGVEKIVDRIGSRFSQGLLLVDGYMTSSIEKVAWLIAERTDTRSVVDIRTFYKPSPVIDALVSECLPEDRKSDPELIYGKLFSGTIQDFLDSGKVENFLKNLDPNEKTILYGYGCIDDRFTGFAEKSVYIDITPKDAAFRINDQKYTNLGSDGELDFDAMARRAYFVDVEVLTKLRRNAIQKQSFDFYILENFQDQFTCIEPVALHEILLALSQRPFRPKPVYIDGVWGGQFIKKLRHIPDEVATKIAWSFELIATEASVAVEVNACYLDIPFLTIMDAVGEKIIGKELYSRFNGYFPIRFNYDDTWHSMGNMSIQCHPTDEMARRIHGDFAGQCEAYYVVITGHDAKTYCGFKDGADGRKFLQLSMASESSGERIPYREYINALDSKPGLQVLLPAGTVHGSGRNQVVLELGSLTINAYTYKIYDYMRKDDNGKLRPIHTQLAQKALDFNRDGKWVSKNVAVDPVLVNDQADYQEFLVGHSDLMYFETYKVNVRAGGTYCGHNDHGFCVFTVVDGEEAEIESAEDTDRKYDAKYLDVVVLPAQVKDFEIKAKGKQPLVLHKAMVRDWRE